MGAKYEKVEYIFRDRGVMHIFRYTVYVGEYAYLDISKVFLGHTHILNILLPVCTAQGGSGSFKDRRPIGEVRCCESWMAEQIH